jgi:hypothetical protein
MVIHTDIRPSIVADIVAALPDELRAALTGRPELEVWAPEPVVRAVVGDDESLAGRVHTVSAGDHVDVAGFGVDVVGGKHAVIHPDVPPVANVGYLLDGAVLHPGDSFDVPTDADVDTLFVPVSGPWLKLSESVEFVRQVAPRRAYALHDGLLNDVGLKVYDTNLANLAGCDYGRLGAGESVAL